MGEETGGMAYTNYGWVPSPTRQDGEKCTGEKEEKRQKKKGISSGETAYILFFCTE